MKTFKQRTDILLEYTASLFSNMTTKTICLLPLIFLVSFIFLSIIALSIFILTVKFFWFAVGAIFFLASAFIVKKGLKSIPAVNPPCIGVLTIWGKKMNVILKEGLVLIAPYLPFLLDLVLIDVVKKNEDFIIENVRCRSEEGEGKSGGAVTVKVGITWIPDEKNPVNYINSGGEQGVRDIMKDMLDEDVRQMGRKKTWQDMTFATDDMAIQLILKLVGREREDEGVEKKELKRYYDLKETERKDSQKTFPILGKILSSGVADEHKLGIKFLRLNVKSVEPEGELKKNAEKVAIEEQQRKAEFYEADTTVEIVKKFKKTGVSPNEAFHGAQVNQGKAKKVVVTGSGGELAKAAAIFAEGKEK